MKKQTYNPFLSLNEYVPDGEPHVFGDRVYLYGSHDAPNGTRFCERDYTVWSAPVSDLSDWRCHGTSYRREQDPRNKPEKPVDFYAPDCVRGSDGRYYLYYCAMGPNVKSFGPMSVAVSQRPEGPFEYLGDIRYSDGSPVLKYLTNDPAVLNDSGRIWLYYGWGLSRDFRSRLLSPLYNFVQSKLFNRTISEIRATKPSILSCAVVELEDDMLTVKGEPKAVLDSKTSAPKGSELYHHAFYEAPSIRKFGELYYLVYSSGENNELAYATSVLPDTDFCYRGVIISNSELGYRGNTKPLNNSGTIHGGIELINSEYYIFYHRCTNNTDFSRQACAERISIAPDGSIEQVELSTCGLGGILRGEGVYPAAICCNLVTPKRIRLGVGRQQKMPRIAQSGDVIYLADLIAGTRAVYKYFDLSGTKCIAVSARGNGVLSVQGSRLSVNSTDYDEYKCNISGSEKSAVRFEIISGKIDIKEFIFT